MFVMFYVCFFFLQVKDAETTAHLAAKPPSELETSSCSTIGKGLGRSAPANKSLCNSATQAARTVLVAAGQDEATKLALEHFLPGHGTHVEDEDITSFLPGRQIVKNSILSIDNEFTPPSSTPAREAPEKDATAKKEAGGKSVDSSNLNSCQDIADTKLV